MWRKLDQAMAKIGWCALLVVAMPALAAPPDGAALVRSGKYAEAQRVLEAQVQKNPKDLAARLELGRVYRLTGQAERERAIWNQFYDDFDDGRIDKKSAKALTYVALAARYLGGWQDANDTFRDAVDADPKGKDGARANIAWAELFLEKYDAGHAEVSLDEALKVLPHDPDARALLARVKLEQADVGGAEREIAKALKAAPRHPGALALRAEIAIVDERFEAALADTALVLADNPEDVRARTLAATVYLLRGERARYEAERARVLKTNPRCSQFFHGIAELLVLHHRYEEANALEAEAVKANPKDWVALAAMGSNLLRLGDEHGVELLQKAWEGDRYNVRTYNLLNLFEDVIPKGYTFIEAQPFRFRVPVKEKKIIEQYVRPMIEREWAELVKRYGFTPAGPLTMELYADPQHYAVRTVGLPGLEALGVTFGRVVTAMSPSLGKFNWGQTLWHEVAHVFSIQLSKSRVPRWFTEGLAEWETAEARPEWSRHTHAELYRALDAGTLLSVAELNRGFTRARNIAQMVVTYHQSAETVGFLIRRFGFPKAVEALKLFGAGKTTPEVIAAVTGLTIEKFDAAFRDDLRRRLAPYAGTFFVRSVDFSDVEDLKARAAKGDARAKGLYALALVRAKQLDEATAILGKVKAPDLAPELLFASAELSLVNKDLAGAKKLYETLIAQKHDGYDVRMKLAELALAEKNPAEAEQHLTRAKALDPHKAEPYVELAKLWMKPRELDALAELEKAALLDCMDASIPRLLVEKHAAAGRFAKVAELAPLALYVAPFDAQVHAHVARAYVELKRHREALREIDAAFACEPDAKLKQVLKTLEGRAGRI